MVSPSDLWPHNPSYGIIATKKFMENHPERLLQFLQVHKESIGVMKKEPEEAARISSEVVGVVGPEFFVECYKVSPRYCAAISDEYISATMDFVSVLREGEYIKRDVAQEEIFDLSFIEKVHPEPHHYDEA
jgi:NitT/TauT family transport system substrate-binding protein